MAGTAEAKQDLEARMREYLESSEISKVLHTHLTTILSKPEARPRPPPPRPPIRHRSSLATGGLSRRAGGCAPPLSSADPAQWPCPVVDSAAPRVAEPRR